MQALSLTKPVAAEARTVLNVLLLLIGASSAGAGAAVFYFGVSWHAPLQMLGWLFLWDVMIATLSLSLTAIGVALAYASMQVLRGRMRWTGPQTSTMNHA